MAEDDPLKGSKQTIDGPKQAIQSKIFRRFSLISTRPCSRTVMDHKRFDDESWPMT